MTNVLTLRTRLCLSTIVSSRLACALLVGLVSSPVLAEGPKRSQPGVVAHGPHAQPPDPDSNVPVSLDKILAYADKNAPAARVARQRLKLGDAAVAGASPLLPYNPQLSVGAGPRITSGGTYTDFQASVSQQIEIGGERGLRLDAAERTRHRFETELEEARWGVHRDVHAGFHRALVARERLSAAQRLLEFQENLVDIARRRLRAGDVSPLAVRLAEGELSEARVSSIAKAQNYLRTRLELGVVAGWPVAHPPTPVGSLQTPRTAPSLAHLLALAEEHQPRLRTLEATLAEARAQAKAADRDGWLEPTVGLQMVREGGPSGAAETVVMGTLSIPLALFRRNQGARAEAWANSEVVEAEQAAFRTKLGNRIEQHRSAVAAAVQAVEIYGVEILPQFEENLRLIQRAFELGEIDVLQVSVARARFLNIRTDTLDAYSTYFQAFANLEASVGTDLWVPTRSQMPSKETAE